MKKNKRRDLSMDTPRNIWEGGNSPDNNPEGNPDSCDSSASSDDSSDIASTPAASGPGVTSDGVDYVGCDGHSNYSHPSPYHQPDTPPGLPNPLLAGSPLGVTLNPLLPPYYGHPPRLWRGKDVNSFWRFFSLTVIIHVLLLSPDLSAQVSATNMTAPPIRQGHRCYVCLPADKGSHEAQEILSLFNESEHFTIPDCEGFGAHNAHQFEITCPDKYIGCLRRALGNNRALVSRTCVNLAINDCKVANSIEYCYCSGDLCNGEKTYPASTPLNPHNDTNGYWNAGITDDEDLLGPNNLEGSGAGPEGDSSSSSSPNDSLDDDSSSSKSGENSSSTSQKGIPGSNRRPYTGVSPASSNKGERKYPVPLSRAPESQRACGMLPVIVTLSAIATTPFIT